MELNRAYGTFPDWERSQGTARWARSARAALDEVTRITLAPGIRFPAFPTRGGFQSPEVFSSLLWYSVSLMIPSGKRKEAIMLRIIPDNHKHLTLQDRQYIEE